MRPADWIRSIPGDTPETPGWGAAYWSRPPTVLVTPLTGPERPPIRPPVGAAVEVPTAGLVVVVVLEAGFDVVVVLEAGVDVVGVQTDRAVVPVGAGVVAEGVPVPSKVSSTPDSRSISS